MSSVVPVAKAGSQDQDHDRDQQWQRQQSVPPHQPNSFSGECAVPPSSGPTLDNAPKISVVVPTCGRAELLNRCLQALVSQSFSATHTELIIVDDAPSASTRDLVQRWATRAARSGLRVQYLANHGVHGPAAARNLGWRSAGSTLIAFTDDDTVPDRDWLQQGTAAFVRGVDVVCGRVRMPIPSAPTDYEADAQQLERAEFVTANCFCRKDTLEKLGGFDERFRLAWREDSDLHFRLIESGATIRYAPKALVVHPVRPAPWGVSISQQRKILFDALLYKKHPRLYRERIRATPRWDYYLAVTALVLAAIGVAVTNVTLFLFASGAWLLLTALLCIRRLSGKAHSWSHVLEMLWTSVLIPPLAVFWRVVGAVRFRVGFV